MPANDILVGAMDAVISANADAVGAGGRLRLTLTSGPAAVGDPTRHRCADVVDHRGCFQAVAGDGDGRRFTVCAQRLGALAGVKSTSYAENAIALRAARRQGCR